ncbi:hypothetical protein OR16_24835 [Cupriavidus basilensis OR16]|uniref:DUF2894 domain-containing protein n=1 Tax=Cupriavidus basilensis OR16 TaxID=1127483 RepID=H1SA48_9BURK|nr:hypothetical protein OR16_24835 [Cupriavidus basilensis OR16]
MLNAWRERGADRLDPVRFHFIDALARRADSHSGDARRILDDRLSKLLDAYADDLESANDAGSADNAGSAASPCEPARGALAGLVDYIASHPPAAGDGHAPNHAAPRRASYPDMEALDYFKAIWSRVSTDRQLRQSLEQVPDNAGPLNSNRLVHRSLSLMRELSPGYLQQFLSYVDALSWLEQMNGGGALAGKDAPRPGGTKTSARGRPR